MSVHKRDSSYLARVDRGGMSFRVEQVHRSAENEKVKVRVEVFLIDKEEAAYLPFTHRK